MTTTFMTDVGIFLIMLAVGIGAAVFLEVKAPLIISSTIMAVLCFAGIHIGYAIGQAIDTTKNLSENYAYTIRTGMLRTYHTDDYTLDDDTLEFTDASGTKHTIRSGSFEITKNKKNAKKTKGE